MNITLHGAAREVTGSCYCVETGTTRILIDCGMFQGSAFNDAKNFRSFGFPPSDVDALIVTHAHLDHTGRIPKLVREGFRGPIYLTKPTVDMTRILLEDAQTIMDELFEREYQPKLYEREDVDLAVESMHGLDYAEWKTIGDISFRFRDAGHIFGSAFVELEERGGARVVFSGDIGNVDAPILKPTAQMAATDTLFIESTYGHRLHEGTEERDQLFLDAIRQTIKRRGVLLIPAFAVERTQELLYRLHDFFAHEAIEPIDTYLDSPMAIRITDVMKRFPEYYDKEATSHVLTGDDFFDFPHLHLTMTHNESKEINDAPLPKMIIAGSGMMTGGRILHHLRRYLSSPTTTLFIVGYQASGTLGKQLYSGEKRVTVLHDPIHVKANIVSVGSYSAHGDQRKLISWIESAKRKPSHVYCAHGEEASCIALASRIQEELGITAHAPRATEVIRT